MIKMNNFNAKEVTNNCINWINDWFNTNGKNCNAVIGISGGKDSSITAALCCKALGNNRVIGVLLPQGQQFDIDYSIKLCNYLNIETINVNIESTVNSVKSVLDQKITMTNQTLQNLPARIRMTYLYAISQSRNGRVANTCNLSENWIGYSTRYGDDAGDFSPLSNLVVREVKEIGRYLNLPEKFIEKPPLDGLCGKTDEDNLGFTYETLDKYIRDNILPPSEIKEKIDYLHKINQFKLKYMDTFNPKK